MLGGAHRRGLERTFAAAVGVTAAGSVAKHIGKKPDRNSPAGLLEDSRFAPKLSFGTVAVRSPAGRWQRRRAVWRSMVRGRRLAQARYPVPKALRHRLQPRHLCSPRGYPLRSEVDQVVSAGAKVGRWHEVEIRELLAVERQEPRGHGNPIARRRRIQFIIHSGSR